MGHLLQDDNVTSVLTRFPIEVTEEEKAIIRKAGQEFVLLQVGLPAPRFTPSFVTLIPRPQYLTTTTTATTTATIAATATASTNTALTCTLRVPL